MTNTRNQQRTDLIAARRRVWGDAVEMCNNDCGREAAPFSCYCDECERKEFADEEA